MFKIVEHPIRNTWVPLDTTSTPTLYEGQLVKNALGDGIIQLATATGIGDTTNLQAISGVIVGFNNRTPVYDATYKRNKLTAVITQAAQVARDWAGQEGQWSKGDPQAMAQIALIGPRTILEAPLFNGTLGTASTLLTVTTGSTDGLSFTANAAQVTPVADLCTSYCRTGANAGIMRISDDTSTTAETNDLAFPYDIAIGDTFIRVPLRPFGKSYVQVDSLAMFFDTAASPVTNYFIIDVLELRLEVAGQESVLFKFHPCHFDSVRA